MDHIPTICRDGQCFIPALALSTSDTYLFLVRLNRYPYGTSEYSVQQKPISQKGIRNEDSQQIFTYCETSAIQIIEEELLNQSRVCFLKIV